jgi:hypothetical protein
VTITQAQITVPLPPFTGIPEIIIPYTPLSIPSLPATIAKLETRLPLAHLVVGLLALALAILLFFLWKRRYNLILVDTGGNAISEAIVYHSLPTKRSPYSPILVTSRPPLSYDLIPHDRGRLYIRHLGRYSTLTVRVNPAGAQHDSRTYILSLSVPRKLYTIVLG